VGFELGSVDYQSFRLGTLARQFGKDLAESPRIAPADEPVPPWSWLAIAGQNPRTWSIAKRRRDERQTINHYPLVDL
jgi:hypothetical protein